MDAAYAKWMRENSRGSLVALLGAAKPTLDTAIRTYVGVDDPVAYSQAKLLAIKAFRSYDPKKGTKLRTHLLTQLQPLRRLAAKRRSVLQVPERVQQQLGTLYTAETDLRDRLNRDPSDAEIADHTGLSIKRIQHVRQFRMTPIAESSYVSPEGEPIQPIVHQPVAADAWADYVYTDLPTTDKKIFEWRTGYGGSQRFSNQEIARRLKLTPSAITQRSARIAKLLDRGVKRGPGNQ